MFSICSYSLPGPAAVSTAGWLPRWRPAGWTSSGRPLQAMASPSRRSAPRSPPGATPLKTRTALLAAAMVLAAPPAAVGGERLAGPFAATVERVIDGDSLAVRVKIWLGLDVSTVVRLRGIDAPELSARCPEERRRALAAREGLAALVAGGEVSLAAVEVFLRPAPPGGRSPRRWSNPAWRAPTTAAAGAAGADSAARTTLPLVPTDVPNRSATLPPCGRRRGGAAGRHRRLARALRAPSRAGGLPSAAVTRRSARPRRRGCRGRLSGLPPR